MRLNYYTIFLLLTLGCLLFPSLSHAQRRLLDKVKEKTEDKVIEKIFGPSIQQPSNTNNYPNSGGSSSTQGMEGGKKLTPPDVNKHIKEAEVALAADQYKNAKFALQQAMTGVELEIGYDVLDKLPTSVLGVDYVKEDDGVYSSGVGFVGLVISRNYRNKSKEIEFTTMNNNAVANLYGGMMGSGTYASSEGDQKAINLDGNSGILRYDSGYYELGVPFGQTSIFLMKCKGCKDENEVIEAAKALKINDIKKRLGEQ